MTTPIAFNRDFTPVYGTVEEVTPLIRRIVAKNPSPFTFTGTNTYIIGRGKVAVIDPGPDMASHLAALDRGLVGEQVTHILVTHTHSDHSPAAAPLKEATGAPILAFGPHAIRRGDEPDVEEGADRTFAPDVTIRHGDIIEGDGWTIEAIHTPGHTSNHVCYALREEQALFPGDHVMGWSTTVISPPDGDMAAYMRNLRALLPRPDVIYYPTHGAPILDPKPLVEALIRHREEREAEILDCIADGLETIPAMVKRMYQNVPTYLHPAAGRSVLAHLIHMTETRRVETEGPPTETSVYRLPD
ncbi:MAG: MBL fold metallo-hydrolase [Alphaproteobacteria bacterium]|nr:MAG: MBL fold metallo-hydrolase [Alphaproteobacteria bacterium]